MNIDISKLIVTIINFALLIVIIVVIAKFLSSTIKASRSNSNIEKKLDTIIELLEKRENEEQR